MTDKPNLLGSFLRARRAAVTPEQAGLIDAGRRQVPGLRRQEVAYLAGISADYYLRLERGRDRNPSVQVIESIARVLQLDDENLTYLLALATEQTRRHRQRRHEPEIVPPGVAKLVAALSEPAFVEGRHFDILAVNPLATALSPRLRTGRNQLRDMLLDPEEIALHPNWVSITECLVASLRHSIGTDIENLRFIELVAELSSSSPHFRDLWSRHAIRVQNGTHITFDHPDVGALRLNRERLAVSGTYGLHLVVYHADAGSSDADKVSRLRASSLEPSGIGNCHR